jgi:lipoprotein-releasing system ATP-binding protein
MHIASGESVAITGVSGAGKSTLLYLMGTLEAPTKGVVRFWEQDIVKMDEMMLCQMRNRQIGFVFQFHHLLPEFNALENTMMPELIARNNKDMARAAAKEILIKVGLETRLYHRVGELSGGEQQRVAIARALIMKPVLLLADEPTGNLDSVTGEGIIELLLHIQRGDGLGMVIATHNEQFAEKMSRRIQIIDGQIR